MVMMRTFKQLPRLLTRAYQNHARCISQQQQQQRRHVNTVNLDNWGYGPTNGPSVWADHFPSARGVCQSPVSIMLSECERRVGAEPLRVRYPRGAARIRDGHLVMQNTGRSCQVNVASPGDADTYVVQGGVLSAVTGSADIRYNLLQFHFHWGGSEHTIDNKQYDAELHLVHGRSDQDAAGNDVKVIGDAEPGCRNMVIGVFIKVVDDSEAAGSSNKLLASLLSSVHRVHYRDDTHQWTDADSDNMSLTDFLPTSLQPRVKNEGDNSVVEVTDYLTYPGSLTTPPCDECVRWILLTEPICVTRKQLSMFRGLKSCHKHGGGGDTHTTDSCIECNFRPVQPLNRRKVVAYSEA